MQATTGWHPLGTQPQDESGRVSRVGHEARHTLALAAVRGNAAGQLTDTFQLDPRPPTCRLYMQLPSACRLMTRGVGPALAPASAAACGVVPCALIIMHWPATAAPRASGGPLPMAPPVSVRCVKGGQPCGRGCRAVGFSCLKQGCHGAMHVCEGAGSPARTSRAAAQRTYRP